MHLSHLQHRHKWKFEKNNIKGDLVLITDDQIAMGNWTKGITLEENPRKYDKIRVVKIKTPIGIYKRTTPKEALLLMNYES